jgi:hypothetical protein
VYPEIAAPEFNILHAAYFCAGIHYKTTHGIYLFMRFLPSTFHAQKYAVHGINNAVHPVLYELKIDVVEAPVP